MEKKAISSNLAESHKQIPKINSKNNIVTKSVTQKPPQTNTPNPTQTKSNNNNFVYNSVSSPKNKQNLQYINNVKNPQANGVIMFNNDKLKIKETITIEEKKITEKSQKSSADKIAQNNNSNVGLISSNNALLLNEKNDFKSKNSGQVKVPTSGQFVNKSSGFAEFTMQKKKSSNKDDETNNSSSINEEISVGNISNKNGLTDKGATKKSTTIKPNQQYISTNYVKDFTNSESNFKIDSKANKIPSNIQKLPSKNNIASNLVYNNAVPNSSTKPLSTKNSGAVSSSTGTNSNGTPNTNKLKEKQSIDKDKLLISNNSGKIKGVSNDTKGKK